ncbi:SusC/RagA family TonB-linked outer membrane protein [Gelidibacter maritimus]|nr:SusC/RagA family TonB-linked outer membrane protein [Gelidibacter maritimus]
MPLTAQQILVSGKVTDGNLPISGANVLIKNTKTGVVTDFDGRYNITAKPTDTLQISYLGYTTVTIPIQSHTTIHVTLQEDVTALGEVQINAGYYTTTDRERTGSISRITAKEIEGQPVNNPLAAMQGYMSGVNIVQTTGVPGGGYDIQIRGKNFINGGTDPLFIIDGVPFSSQSLGSNSVSAQITGGNISPLNAINPNDIESIEVLKDGDATAIYGSRGANGVVLITTNKGGTGKTQFKANISSGVGQVSHFIDLMNTEQYLETRNEGIINDGYQTLLNDPAYDYIWPDVKSWDQNRYTNWQKELIGGTAHRNNAQLSVLGGNAETRFLISGSYNKETTVFPGDAKYKKMTVFSSLNHRSMNNRFSIDFSSTYSNEKNNLPRSDFTSLAYSLEPNAPALYDQQGNLNWENNSWDNPLASLNEQYEASSNTLFFNSLISFQLLPNLALKSNLGHNNYSLHSYRTLPSSARNPKFGFTPQSYSSLTTNGSERQSWIVEPQLHWSKQWRRTTLDALIGTTFQQETGSQFVQNGKGFPNNNLLLNLTAANNVNVLQDDNSKYNYNAIFGRLNMNYLGRYIINLTGRRDGSSRFGPGKQFGNFGAAGIAWLFSEEAFLNKNSLLSFGKLRGSYGVTGSDNIGNYKFLDTYNVTGLDYNGITVLEPTGIFNPLFGWESNKKLELALELGFFKERLFINTSWYRNRSSDQLIGIPLPATTGFSTLTGNFNATVENSGFEIDFRIIDLLQEKIKWTAAFNIAVPKNKLIKFDGLETSTFSNQYIIGKPLSILKLYNALGVDQETGSYKFEDYNGDGNISSPEDRQWLEDLSPKFYGGLSNTLSYGNFTLNMFLQFKNQKAFNEFVVQATPGLKGNASIKLLDRWQQPGDTNPIKMASGGLSRGRDNGSFLKQSNAAISDASFIRLRNVSLNYYIPTLNTFDINVYLQGQNLLTFTNFGGPDPEQSFYNTLPPLKQITLGIKIDF